MGISLSQARLLIRQAKRSAFKGAVLQLGRQNIGFSESQLQLIAIEEGFTLYKVGEVEQSTQLIEKVNLSDIRFFNLLGFTSVNSLDINDFEGASIIHDLNIPMETDSSIYNFFDLVFDGGTMEHIFHTPNFLINCCNLLKVNGRIIHAVPIDLFNHGFYNFSSTLFEDFYAVNNFEVEDILVIRKNYFNNTQWSSCVSANGNSQFIRSLYGGIFDGANHLLFVVVTKKIISTSDKIPMQGYYVNLHDKKINQNNAGLIYGDSLFKSFYQTLLKVPIVGRLAFLCRNYYANLLVKWDRI